MKKLSVECIFCQVAPFFSHQNGVKEAKISRVIFKKGYLFAHRHGGNSGAGPVPEGGSCTHEAQWSYPAIQCKPMELESFQTDIQIMVIRNINI